MKKCLIVDPMHESLFAMLREIGWQPDYHPDIKREEIKLKHAGYDGLIVRSKTVIDRDLLGDQPTLKFVGRAGAGIDNLDLDYLQQKRIHVLHAAEGNRDAVGEFTVGLLIGLLRNIPKADKEVRDGSWQREANRGEELQGKTVSLIGYGNMGQAFARRLSGFGCKVLAYDKYKTGFTDTFSREATLEEIFELTDILSLHIPLTSETKGMVTGSYMNQFKKNVIILNTARGEIIPMADLVLMLENGKIRGVALDVLENEKLNSLTALQQQSFNYLKAKSNVIFTPHIAGWTFESHLKINVALVEKIKNLGL
jgi:D-3-phosphoglycerate dehydrogenase / 2-oxoglutarate reductase